MFLRVVNPSSITTASRLLSSSAYKRTAPLNKGFALKDMHIKEKVVSTEKSLVVLAVATLAIMLPSPYSSQSGLEPGMTELDCLNNFEEPFDSH
jgi:hypothetical protein|eukprot:scaffold13330_cov205-Alexandrium_tamarense.AAC.8